VDSQSFALDVPDFPELAAAGAYSSSMMYTPDDVKDIVNYAAAVGSIHHVCLLLSLNLNCY